MPKANIIKSIISEYGMPWAFNRTLYSAKLKMMSLIPAMEKIYEKNTPYPTQINLFKIDVDALRSFIRTELSDGDKEELISIADKACEGIIIGFSSIELDYGNPIDWQLNPLTCKRCNEYDKWYKIPDFDKDRGDIKIIWEVSRFSHFITLARAYLLTEDKKYYKVFSSQLDDWLKKNEYGYGANFKCSQECSLRMINALLAYTIFNRCGLTEIADTENIKKLINRCYRKILSNFFYAYKCIKNNHTVSELMGMIVGAWCSGDQKQLDKGYRLLDEVIDEQFTDDGGYRQFSFNYQRLALQDIEVVMSISEVTGKSFKKKSIEKIKKSAMLMYQCQDESGDVPNYGSNDGALVFPVTSCGYRDFRPVINTSYALTTGNQLYESGKQQEELIWFSGNKRINEYEIKIVDRVSSQFPDAGLFTIRGGTSWAMVVSNDYHSRPAHMDQLHFDLWINNVNVLCDSGTFSYVSEEGRELVKNNSHNTVVIKNKTQMNSKGPFMVYDWTKRKLGKCDETSVTGESISVNGYRHIRSVKKIGQSYEIRDRVDHDYIVLFHTPCEVEIEESKALLYEKDKVICVIRSNGKMNLQKSYRSLYYLKKENSNCLSIEGQAGKVIKLEIVEGEN